MTAQKTITVMATVTSFAAALLGAWSYTRGGEASSLLMPICFAFAGLMGLVQLRRADRFAPGSFNPVGAGRTIAKFSGFAGVCLALIFLRARGQVSSLVEPVNVLLLLASLFSLALGLYFALLLRESRNT
jgi:hypothetical protein